MTNAAELDEKLKAVFSAGGNTAQLAELYDAWAPAFEQDIWASANPYIAIVAGYVGRQVRNLEACVLDAGCGTGLLGQILAHMGYRNLVGLDASRGMLEVARTKKVYSELHQLLLDENIPLPEARFDAITAAGVLTHGHAPPASLNGLLRLAKPGAALIFSLSEVAANEGGFLDKMLSLERQNAWTSIANTAPFQSFPFSQNQSHLYNRIHVYVKTR